MLTKYSKIFGRTIGVGSRGTRRSSFFILQSNDTPGHFREYLHQIEKVLENLPNPNTKLPGGDELFAFKEKIAVHVEKIWAKELEHLNNLYNKGEYSQLIRECESILKNKGESNEITDPMMSKVYTYLGKVLSVGLSELEWENAEKHLQKAIELDSENEDAKIALDDLLVSHGKKEVIFTYKE